MKPRQDTCTPLVRCFELTTRQGPSVPPDGRSATLHCNKEWKGYSVQSQNKNYFKYRHEVRLTHQLFARAQKFHWEGCSPCIPLERNLGRIGEAPVLKNRNNRRQSSARDTLIACEHFAFWSVHGHTGQRRTREACSSSCREAEARVSSRQRSCTRISNLPEMAAQICLRKSVKFDHGYMSSWRRHRLALIVSDTP